MWEEHITEIEREITEIENKKNEILEREEQVYFSNCRYSEIKDKTES